MYGAGAAFQLFGSVGQYLSGQMAAESRQMQFKEQIRQLTMKRDYTVGLATARAAASETDMNSASTVDYLKKLTGEFNTEIQSLTDVAAATKGADTMGNAFGLIGGVGGATNTFLKTNGY